MKSRGCLGRESVWIHNIHSIHEHMSSSPSFRTRQYAPSLPPKGANVYLPFEYGKASKSWKQQQILINEAEDNSRKFRLLKRFNDRIDRKKFPNEPVCGPLCHGPCCTPQDSVPVGGPESEPQSEVELLNGYCIDCKTKLKSGQVCACDSDSFEPGSPESKDAKSPSAPDLDCDEEMPEVQPGAPTPKTIAASCVVCSKKVEINPEYQSAECTTCSEECFLKDYNDDSKKYFPTCTTEAFHHFIEIAKSDRTISFTLRYQDCFADVQDKSPYSMLHQNQRHLG